MRVIGPYFRDAICISQHFTFHFTLHENENPVLIFVMIELNRFDRIQFY